MVTDNSWSSTGEHFCLFSAAVLFASSLIFIYSFIPEELSHPVEELGGQLQRSMLRWTGYLFWKPRGVPSLSRDGRRP